MPQRLGEENSPLQTPGGVAWLIESTPLLPAEIRSSSAWLTDFLSPGRSLKNGQNSTTQTTPSNPDAMNPSRQAGMSASHGTAERNVDEENARSSLSKMIGENAPPQRAISHSRPPQRARDFRGSHAPCTR